ncbi:hypothetical protein D0T51_02600 [Parabacteroides sp. 52]|uniref:hypothetical protein n=1 Tax=unclassified Parabacteroides TaxID=2649774 RepID=UPI0013D1EA30|nr:MULTISPECIES: hypothetical protein [unclassified Parabacteroides]MDH6533879.1 hypothetical protein [Parabacteroides sp. PM5-20]NDV54624.1 hypothetical protein [Parabacteroides sp. 52]
MSLLLYLFFGLFSLVLCIGLIGLLLPRERVVTRQSRFSSCPEKVYKLVTNNEEYAYRSDVQEVRILERKGDFEVWEEVALRGNVMLFRTKEKIPYTFYSLSMEGNLFTGYWTATFKETEEGGTLFTATEYIRIKNPYLKVLSYPFFDIGKFMESYQDDLRSQLGEKREIFP